MPYSIHHNSPKCWEVVNTETGKVHAKCTTKKRAEAQLHLLEGVDHGWRPTGKKSHPKNGRGPDRERTYPIRHLPENFGQVISFPPSRPQKQEAYPKLDPDFTTENPMYGGLYSSRVPAFYTFIRDRANMNPHQRGPLFPQQMPVR
jgi:hypothetical protein